MKTFKALTITLVLLLVAGIATSDAQRRGMQQGPVDGGILSAEVTEQLQLTDAQRLRILDLRTAQQVRMRELRDTFRDGDTTPNEMREQREALRESHDTALKDILSEEQFEKLMTIRAERQALNRSQRPNRNNAAGYGTGNRGPRGAGVQGQGPNRPNRPAGN